MDNKVHIKDTGECIVFLQRSRHKTLLSTFLDVCWFNTANIMLRIPTTFFLMLRGGFNSLMQQQSSMAECETKWSYADIHGDRNGRNREGSTNISKNTHCNSTGSNMLCYPNVKRTCLHLSKGLHLCSFPFSYDWTRFAERFGGEQNSHMNFGCNCKHWWWTGTCYLPLKGTQTFKQPPQTEHSCFQFHLKVSIFLGFGIFPKLTSVAADDRSKAKHFGDSHAGGLTGSPSEKKLKPISFLFCTARKKLPAVGCVWTRLGGPGTWTWLPEATEDMTKHTGTYTRTLNNDNLSWRQGFWELMKDDMLGKGNYAWKPVKTVPTTPANCD